MDYVYQSGELYLAHHGILGQKWGIRRYQNEDGSLTPKGKKRYQAILKDAKKFGDSHAQTERMTRAINEARKQANIPKDAQMLVPSDVKEAYRKSVQDFINNNEIMTKKYGDIRSEIRSMDDGYDYVVSWIKAKELNGYVEYYSLIGKTQKV